MKEHKLIKSYSKSSFYTALNALGGIKMNRDSAPLKIYEGDIRKSDAYAGEEVRPEIIGAQLHINKELLNDPNYDVINILMHRFVHIVQAEAAQYIERHNLHSTYVSVSDDVLVIEYEVPGDSQKFLLSVGILFEDRKERELSK